MLRELAMTEDDDVAARNKREMRLMYGVSAGIVLLILGIMGANMLWGPHTPANAPTDMSSQSRSVPSAPN
jgi:hypothetical protein